MNNRNVIKYIALFGMGLFAAGLGHKSLSGNVVTVAVPDISQIAIASFERDLNHEAGSAITISRNSIDNDILYQKLNSVHWSNTTELD